MIQNYYKTALENSDLIYFLLNIVLSTCQVDVQHITSCSAYGVAFYPTHQAHLQKLFSTNAMVSEI